MTGLIIIGIWAGILTIILILSIIGAIYVTKQQKFLIEQYKYMAQEFPNSRYGKPKFKNENEVSK